MDLSASRRDRVTAEAAFTLEIGVASRANAGGFILRSAVRELSRHLAQLRWLRSQSVILRAQGRWR